MIINDKFTLGRRRSPLQRPSKRYTVRQLTYKKSAYSAVSAIQVCSTGQVSPIALHNR